MESLCIQRRLKQFSTSISGSIKTRATTCAWLLGLVLLLFQQMLVSLHLEVFVSVILVYFLDGQIKAGSGIDQVFFRVASNAYVDKELKKVSVNLQQSTDLSGLRMCHIIATNQFSAIEAWI